MRTSKCKYFTHYLIHILINKTLILLTEKNSNLKVFFAAWLLLNLYIKCHVAFLPTSNLSLQWELQLKCRACFYMENK